MSLRTVIAAAALGTSASIVYGQVPAIPAVPGVPVAPAAAIPAGGAVPAVPAVPGLPTAAPRNIFSYFMLTPDQKAACAAKKTKFCNSQLGLLLNNVVKPASAFTGGILPGCCPPSSANNPATPNPEDLKKPATEAEGAAARIKQQEAGAADRKAAVRYLGTVNCKRFPEAETALIGALRTDTNECVRFEAAMGLARGCCCSTKTIKALTLTVNGSDADGNPPETSPRVRAMAAQALARCCGTVDPTPPKEPPPELPPGNATPEAVARRIESVDREKTLVDGRKAWNEFQTETAGPSLMTGRRTVADTIRYAMGPTTPVVMALPTPVIPPPTVGPAALVVPASATMPVPMPPAAAPQPSGSPATTTNLPTGRRTLVDLFHASRSPGR